MQIVISRSLAVERNRDIPKSDKQVNRYLHQKFQENLTSFFCVCLRVSLLVAQTGLKSQSSCLRA